MLDDGPEYVDDEGDVLLVFVEALVLLMAVTEAHSCSAVMSAEVPTLAVALVVPALVLTLASAFLEASARQVRLTTSPAWMSFRLETALPCTGRVMLCAAMAALEPVLGLVVELEVVLTVIVLALVSTETISAWTIASFLSLSALASALASVFDGLVSSVRMLLSFARLLSCALSSCWATANPAAKTRPSSRVVFFMFPPVVRLSGSR